MSGRDWARLAIFIVIAGLTGWWLGLLAQRLGVAPVVDDSGNVLVDEFQQTKDILLVLVPLLTAAIGYFAGAEGKEKVEEQRDKVQADLTNAQAVLERARSQHPDAFKN